MGMKGGFHGKKRGGSMSMEGGLHGHGRGGYMGMEGGFHGHEGGGPWEILGCCRSFMKAVTRGPSPFLILFGVQAKRVPRQRRPLQFLRGLPPEGCWSWPSKCPRHPSLFSSEATSCALHASHGAWGHC